METLEEIKFRNKNVENSIAIVQEEKSRIEEHIRRYKTQRSVELKSDIKKYVNYIHRSMKERGELQDMYYLSVEKILDEQERGN